MRPARTPPEPPPITNRSKSCAGMGRRPCYGRHMGISARLHQPWRPALTRSLTRPAAASTNCMAGRVDMSGEQVASIEMLRRLVSFDTTSRHSNLALIEHVRDYLKGHGIASSLVPNKEGTKANLYATI